MLARFKWWCCRYMLRVICVDSSYDDCGATIFHICRDRNYRLGMHCEKEDCQNCRKEHGLPKTVRKVY